MSEADELRDINADEDEEEERSVPMKSFLVFQVSGETFAIETEQISEIVRYKGLTPVPEFPDYVSGVAAVGERTVPVINAARRFRYEDMGIHPRKCIVIAFAGPADESGVRREIGLLADNVVKIRDVQADKVLPPPEVNSEAFTRYVKGSFIRSNGTPCFIVSPELMMSEEEKDDIYSAVEKL